MPPRGFRTYRLAQQALWSAFAVVAAGLGLEAFGRLTPGFVELGSKYIGAALAIGALTHIPQAVERIPGKREWTQGGVEEG